LERKGVEAAALVTGRFRKLSEFVLANQEKAPEHRLVVLEDNFEFSDPAELERSARAALLALFGEGEK
jgi:hypothetical protein